MLIVGCGCRGRALARTLVADGHGVRGSSRDAGRLAEIEAVGAEGVVADPDRLGTLLPALDGVGVVVWALASAHGQPEAVAALHGPRLRSLVAKLVDTPVRGFVYEGAGSVPGDLRAEGAAIVREAGATFRLPVAVVEEDPADPERWVAAMRDAVEAVLASRG